MIIYIPLWQNSSNGLLSNQLESWDSEAVNIVWTAFVRKLHSGHHQYDKKHRAYHRQYVRGYRPAFEKPSLLLAHFGCSLTWVH